jgi:hypothetical protein
LAPPLAKVCEAVTPEPWADPSLQSQSYASQRALLPLQVEAVAFTLTVSVLGLPSA